MFFVGVLLRVIVVFCVLGFILAGSKTLRQNIIKNWVRIFQGETNETLNQRLLVGTLFIGVTWQTIAGLWNIFVSSNLNELSLLGLIIGIPINVFVFIWYKRLHLSIKKMKQGNSLEETEKESTLLLLPEGNKSEDLNIKDNEKLVSIKKAHSI